MNVPRIATGLLAEVLTPGDVFDALGSGFRGDRARFDTSEQLQLLGLLVVVVVGGWVLSRLLARQETLRRTNSPRGLFQELCQAHHLGWRDRLLLSRLAQARGATQAAEVFVRPALFAGDLPASLQRHRARLEELAAVLFTWPDAPEEHSEGPPSRAEAVSISLKSSSDSGDEYWLPPVAPPGPTG